MRIPLITLLICVALGHPARAEELASTRYPLRVHYPRPDLKAYAEQVVTVAEQAWSFQVEGLGFPPPPKDAGAGGSDDFDIFIQDDSQTDKYAAFATATAPAADRLWGYCSRIVMGTAVPEAALPLIVSHELQHAIQAGICKGGNNIAEASAVYISGIERRGQAWQLSYALGINAFQTHPERSLDWQGELGNFYPYGGALFLMFLDQVHGEAQQGAFIRKIWETLGKIKEPSKTSTFYPTYPHYFDAMASLVDLDAAYKKFSRWRYFVGPDDDGRHLRDLAIWEGPSADGKLLGPALAADLQASALPVTAATPSTLSMPYGAIYVRLALAGITPEESVHVAFWGDPGVRWSIQHVLLRDQGAPEEGGVEAAADGQAAFDLAVKDHRTLVLAFVNLGDGAYRPEGSGWQSRPLRYSLTRVPPAPIEPVAPGAPPASGCAMLAAGRSPGGRGLCLAGMWVVSLVLFALYRHERSS